MQRRIVFPLLLIAGLLLTGIACTLSAAQEDLQTVATSVRQGKDLLSTGQAAATEMWGSSAVQTARAVATSQGSRLLSTAKAVITESGPEMLATARAITTRIAPISTQTPIPSDIPVPPGSSEGIFVTNDIISFSVNQGAQEVASFYERELPPQGWTKVEEGSGINGNLTVLHYEKNGRKMILTITEQVAGQVFVVISLTPG